eukprot:400657-Pyramimonas_sp.AAC.1
MPTVENQGHPTLRPAHAVLSRHGPLVVCQQILSNRGPMQYTYVAILARHNVLQQPIGRRLPHMGRDREGSH